MKIKTYSELKEISELIVTNEEYRRREERKQNNKTLHKFLSNAVELVPIEKISIDEKDIYREDKVKPCITEKDYSDYDELTETVVMYYDLNNKTVTPLLARGVKQHILNVDFHLMRIKENRYIQIESEKIGLLLTREIITGDYHLSYRVNGSNEYAQKIELSETEARKLLTEFIDSVIKTIISRK